VKHPPSVFPGDDLVGAAVFVEKQDVDRWDLL